MNAQSIMQPHVITSHELASLREIATHMVIGRISGFPIVDDSRTVVGIVTELDIIKALQPGLDLDNSCAADVMTRDLIWVDAEAPINSVMQVLTDQRIIRVPVLSGGELVGIVSRGDILRATLNEHQKAA
ncbi:MAG: CBS domain-containing protein [Chloroflexi bacterium]|nr:CBS domain-containing protein [Chloroflexota bacterium]